MFNQNQVVGHNFLELTGENQLLSITSQIKQPTLPARDYSNLNIATTAQSAGASDVRPWPGH